MDSDRVKRFHNAIIAAEQFLLSHQSSDGLWRDYPALQPGCSEAWTTGVVGCSLATPPVASNRRLLVKAAEALHSIATPNGWGYNRQTACDADSTAWVWRFLAQLEFPTERSAVRDLQRFIGDDQAVHTFLGGQFGTWAQSHPDVTPVVGLACLAVHASPKFTDLIREAALAHRAANGLWHSFWWNTDSYAIARNLEFLSALNGIPGEIRELACMWLAAVNGQPCPFVLANELAIAASVNHDIGIRHCEKLLSCQQDDGGWSPSATLLVPSQQNPDAHGSAPSFTDERRIMSTAWSLAALKSWRHRRCHGSVPSV